MPTYRYLKGYTLDPSFSTLLATYTINETLYKIRWENVERGPLGDYLEIIDVDPPNSCFYEPVDLNDMEVISQNGLRPSEGNPQFHQQFVYTIAMSIIDVFEDALGRKIIWRPQLSKDDEGQYTEDYIPRLRIYPHALLEANAYYTPDKKAILFGYFKAKQLQQGINVPGGTVFTCLSPDIIAHEMTHAILDSIHPHFIENTNLDVGAFHEAFADTVALLQRLHNRDLVIHQLEQASGKLDNESVFGELATQVGQAIVHGHTSLRSAIGSKENGTWVRRAPNPDELSMTKDVHGRGAIFVACIFDAFIRLYDYRTRDLFRIAQYNTLNTSNLISPDLINRLADEVLDISQNLLKIIIQALDFVPPCDISFGDYIRALITADCEIAPEDVEGYRIALIEAFREWGFYADRVNTMSVESLRWNDTKDMFESDFEQQSLDSIINFLKPKIRELLGLKGRKEIYNKTKEINVLLHEIILQGIGSSKSDRLDRYRDFYQFQAQQKVMDEHIQDDKWKDFLTKLGLQPNVSHKYEYEGKVIPFTPRFKLQVLNVRPVYRSSREGLRIDQVIVSLLQTLRVDKKDHELDGLRFRGGCTLIFDLSETSDLSYAIVKRLTSKRRLQNQLQYQMGGDNFALNSNSYIDDDSPFQSIQLKNLHQL